MSKTLLYVSLALNLFFAWRWAPPVTTQRLPRVVISVPVKAPPSTQIKLPTTAPVELQAQVEELEETPYETLVKDDAEASGARLEKLRDYMLGDLGFSEDEIQNLMARIENSNIQRSPAIESAFLEGEVYGVDEADDRDETLYR